MSTDAGAQGKLEAQKAGSKHWPVVGDQHKSREDQKGPDEEIGFGSWRRAPNVERGNLEQQPHFTTHLRQIFINILSHLRCLRGWGGERISKRNKKWRETTAPVPEFS